MKILFICTGNTCRSVLAMYLARKRFPEFHFESVGLHPQAREDAENAIYTLNKLRIDATVHIPRGLDSVMLSNFDKIVAMDKSVAKTLMDEGLHKDKLIVWKIDDPWNGTHIEYLNCAGEINKALNNLRAEMKA